MKTRHIERSQEQLPPYRVMTCECGDEHDSRYISGDFECSCRRLYNSSGQQLESLFGNGDEEYWEEELRC